MTFGTCSLCNIVATIYKRNSIRLQNDVCWINHPAVYSCPEYTTCILVVRMVFWNVPLSSEWTYYFKSKLKGLLFAYYPRQPVDLSWPSKCTIHSLKLRCFIFMQFFTIGHPDCVPIHSIEICQFVIYTIWKEKKYFFPLGTLVLSL